MKFHTIIISAIEYGYIITKYQCEIILSCIYGWQFVLIFPQNGCFIFIEWSLLYFVQSKIIHSVQIYLFCTFYTYMFIHKLLQNYSTDNRANNSKELLQLQHQGDRPALRGPASVEGTGQHRGDRPVSRGPASVKGTSQHRGDQPALREPTSVEGTSKRRGTRPA